MIAAANEIAECLHGGNVSPAHSVPLCPLLVAAYRNAMYPLTRICQAVLLLVLSATAHAKTATEIFESASGSVVVVYGNDTKGSPINQGSGVVLPGGAVVTNCHVIDDAARVVVKHQQRKAPFRQSRHMPARNRRLTAAPGVSHTPRNPIGFPILSPKAYWNSYPLFPSATSCAL